jgi:dTMP kinase
MGGRATVCRSAVEVGWVLGRLAKLRNTEQGRLVVVCGVDGAGKTSLIARLRDKLPEACDREIVCTRQPTTEARELPIFSRYLYEPTARPKISYAALTAVMLADRLQHMHEVVEPALKRGAIVLCDRYIYTMVAAMVARGFDYPWIYPACAEFLEPDVAVLLDVSFETACVRIRARSKSPDEPSEPSHLRAMINAFRRLVEEDCFDAVYQSDYLSPAEIGEAVRERLLASLAVQSA